MLLFSCAQVLYVQKSFDVDNLGVGDASQLELTVEMTSGYQTSLATVKVTLIDENDNSPVFEKNGMTEVVSVPENARGKLNCCGFAFLLELPS